MILIQLYLGKILEREVVKIRKSFEDLQAKARSNPKIAEFLDGESVVLARKVFSKRMSLGLTQQQLADQAGVEVKMIHRIEGGSSGISAKIIEKIFRALNIAETTSNN